MIELVQKLVLQYGRLLMCTKIIYQFVLHACPRTIPPGQFPPSTIAPRTISPQTITSRIIAPPYNSHLFSPRIIDLQDRWSLDISHLGLFWLGWLPPDDYGVSKFSLSFRLCHNKILYKHKHALFQNIPQAPPFRIISEIFELLFKVWNVFIASLILAY